MDALTPSGPQVEHEPGRLLAKAEAPPTFTWVASPTTLTALSTVTLSIMPTANASSQRNLWPSNNSQNTSRADILSDFLFTLPQQLSLSRPQRFMVCSFLKCFFRKGSALWLLSPCPPLPWACHSAQGLDWGRRKRQTPQAWRRGVCRLRNSLWAASRTSKESFVSGISNSWFSHSTFLLLEIVIKIYVILWGCIYVLYETEIINLLWFPLLKHGLILWRAK